MGRVGCSGSFPCLRCEGDGEVCQRSPNHLITTMRLLWKDVVDGEFINNDIARYQLHMQILLARLGRKIFKTLKDVAYCFERLQRRHLGGETLPCPVGVVSSLPRCLSNFLEGKPYHKIEWMTMGRYISHISTGYEQNVMSSAEIMNQSKSLGYPLKLIDTCGLSQYDIPYRMWCETLFHPAMEVVYTGMGYWKVLNKCCMTTVRMMSVVINQEYVVTVTCLSKGSMLIL